MAMSDGMQELPVKADVRKAIGKEAGDTVRPCPRAGRRCPGSRPRNEIARRPRHPPPRSRSRLQPRAAAHSRRWRRLQLDVITWSGKNRRSNEPSPTT